MKDNKGIGAIVGILLIVILGIILYYGIIFAQDYMSEQHQTKTVYITAIDNTSSRYITVLMDGETAGSHSFAHDTEYTFTANATNNNFEITASWYYLEGVSLNPVLARSFFYNSGDHIFIYISDGDINFYQTGN